ncbi:hypothetical protein PF008_g25206 [Phytophthora fragariae]|uniref:Uncharacterized protein n=1 Tax=Phytophthora fragariae TaxID=53985 RepID=A0A6G0QLF4_9STRA|nr:hypothetical protein PF008_g25206 [Phytophthora fragariae]
MRHSSPRHNEAVASHSEFCHLQPTTTYTTVNNPNYRNASHDAHDVSLTQPRGRGDAAGFAPRQARRQQHVARAGPAAATHVAVPLRQGGGRGGLPQGHRARGGLNATVKRQGRLLYVVQVFLKNPEDIEGRYRRQPEPVHSSTSRHVDDHSERCDL